MAANIQYSEKYYDETFEYRHGASMHASVDLEPLMLTRCSRSRHVVLPPEITALLPKGRLLSEVETLDLGFQLRRDVDRVFLSQAEWRGIGVQQSRGWVHYAIHRPEPHIMLFR